MGAPEEQEGPTDGDAYLSELLSSMGVTRAPSGKRQPTSQLQPAGQQRQLQQPPPQQREVQQAAPPDPMQLLMMQMLPGLQMASHRQLCQPLGLTPHQRLM